MKLRIKIIILLSIIGILLSGCISKNGQDGSKEINNAENKINGGINNEEDNISQGMSNQTPKEIEGTDQNLDEGARIESIEGYAIDSEKLKIRLIVYNNDNKIIKSEGTLESILYEIEDREEGPVLGKELDRWKSQIKENDYEKNNELVKELEFHNKNVTSPSGFGHMDYTFTTKDGIFQTADDFINLTKR